MTKGWITLIQASALTDLAQLRRTVEEVRKYFESAGWKPAPFPNNLSAFVECDVLIQELPKDEGKRLGRIVLTDKTDDILYEQYWHLEEGPNTL